MVRRLFKPLYSKITELEGALNSVKKLQSVIVSELGVSEENTLFIYDKNQYEITTEIMEFENNIQKDDVVIFYFCGHGIKVGDELWLFTNNTIKKSIEMTALNYNIIIKSLRNSPSKRVLVILDCCNSGAALTMGEDNGKDIKKEVICEGEVILCSCAEIESAIQVEIDHELHCVFTYTFAEVLSKGSTESKEFLSVSDIVHLLKEQYEKISGKTLSIGRKQNLDTYGIIKNMEYTRKTAEENSEELTKIRAQFKRWKKWKILLVKCDIKYPTRGIDFGVPLGLWVIKNYITLCRPNIQVDIYDERLLSFEKRAKNFDTLIEEYDVIGISMCTCEVPMAIDKFRIAHNKGKITVAGGIFTYSNERYLINSKVVDYVIPGVGTVPWIRLLDALMVNQGQGTKNQIVNVNNVFSKNNLDTTVWLTDTMPGMELHEWDDILKNYGSHIKKEVFVGSKKISVPKIDIVTSRGCNQKCSFCSVRFETGSSVIKRLSTVIEEEIDFLYSKGVRYFSIKDENFFIHGTNRVKEIMQHCSQYADIHFKIRMRLDDWNRTDIDLATLREWGVDEVQYGVESPQSDILSLLQKGMAFERGKIVDLFKEHYANKIKVNASLILGCSELEDSEYYENLKKFIMEIYDGDYLIPYFNFYTPHPINSTFVNDKYTVTTNDLNFYTHKIPVAYPKNMRQPERSKMVETYDEITHMTNSSEYNPPIPEDAKDVFVKGKAVGLRGYR